MRYRQNLIRRVAQRGVGKVLSKVTTVSAEQLTRPHGVDASDYNDPWEYKDITPYSQDFFIGRASFGTLSGEIYTDRAFEHLYNVSLNVPVRGAYHYFSSHSSWKAQADYFLNVIRDKDIHFIAWDFESAYNVQGSTFANDAKRAYEYLTENFDGKVLLYTNPNVYKHWLKPYLDEGWLSSVNWWFAQYWWNPSPFKDPAVPQPWKFWQYSADGNFMGDDYGFASYALDLDVYNGTVAEMHEWLGIGDPPPPVDDALDKEFVVQCVSEYEALINSAMVDLKSKLEME